MVRPDVVDQLVTCINTALEKAVVELDANSNEVLSAYFTCAKFAARTAREQGADIPILRGCIQRILLECYDPKLPPA